MLNAFDASQQVKIASVRHTCGGRGPRLDTNDREFLAFALQLERYLERCARHPFMPRRKTPRLIAATTVTSPSAAAAKHADC